MGHTGTVVNTTMGQVRGVFEKTMFTYDYIAFKGIPYAKPPVGELRFQDPQPVTSWINIRDADTSGPMCVQCNLKTGVPEGSEDCLYLNVYARPWDPNTKRPVMFWIHGGGFANGNGNDDTYAPDYILHKDIVFVSINYRLGVFGFLNLEDEIAPGNQGLKDQVKALEWVRDNIAIFGGDPGNVTIFGTSTGGVSVHLLCLSPLSKGLFHKAIIQSGVALNPWVRQIEPKKMVYRLCELLGKKTTDHTEIINFLRTVDPYKLVEVQEKKLLTKLEKLQLMLAFGPGVDAKSPIPFIPIDIEHMAKEGVHVPLLIGHVNMEAIPIVKFARNQFDLINSNLSRCLHPLAVNLMKKNYDLLVEDLKHIYFKHEKISKNNIKPLIDLAGDVYFIEGIHRVINIQVEKDSKRTYMYQFSYDREQSFTKNFLNIDHIEGTVHGDELLYLFRPKLSEKLGRESLQLGTEPFKVMMQLTDIWTNFAATGRPTPTPKDLIPVYWNTDTKMLFLNIDKELRMDVTQNIKERYNSYKLARN